MNISPRPSNPPPATTVATAPGGPFGKAVETPNPVPPVPMLRLLNQRARPRLTRLFPLLNRILEALKFRLHAALLLFLPLKHRLRAFPVEMVPGLFQDPGLRSRNFGCPGQMKLGIQNSAVRFKLIYDSRDLVLELVGASREACGDIVPRMCRWRARI
ncbi:hypothetical protein BU26DRAFT_514233 [Trematosphaeria pertusa]|uniref:Uncharacterized protein n=1 Tax=Trematosphaeria pertusa TaxID=390896 RepID=A0A6A6IVJ4_9PLEO|nr:uncharacterized protein BU26DRAFT_514233 [Trematosphaeria pertusa]KAF2254268.1 hypothetical protein BU26DRAFT_514233 [Trematosphaeria pertusa]